MQKIEQLAEQIDFLLKVQEESLEGCLRGFKDLIASIEQVVAKQAGSQESQDGAERVQEFLAARMEEMRTDLEAEIGALREQHRMAAEALTLPQGQRRDEICELILGEAGELDDTELFKRRVLQETIQSRKEFLAMLDDIHSALKEGGVEELEALFEAMELDDAAARDNEEDEEYSCCGSCSDCCGCGGDLNDGCGESAEVFKKVAEPYIMAKSKGNKESN
jgi:hypothetical protein